jgi:hypothetical protein
MTRTKTWPNSMGNCDDSTKHMVEGIDVCISWNSYMEYIGASYWDKDEKEWVDIIFTQCQDDLPEIEGRRGYKKHYDNGANRFQYWKDHTLAYAKLVLNYV